VANSVHLDLNTARDVLWLHKRMGHPSRLTMYQSIMHGTWTGLPDGLKPAQVNKILKNFHCLACELSKRNKNPTEQGDGFHALLPGEEISVDYQGKIEPPSVRGFTGFYLSIVIRSWLRARTRPPTSQLSNWSYPTTTHMVMWSENFAAMQDQPKPTPQSLTT
jgi:hypothetical protein